jgi:hypothetical protein
MRYLTVDNTCANARLIENHTCDRGANTKEVANLYSHKNSAFQAPTPLYPSVGIERHEEFDVGESLSRNSKIASES